MARYSVYYEVVLEHSILVDAPDQEAAEDTVERWVQNGQHLSKPTDFNITETVAVEDDPAGDW